MVSVCALTLTGTVNRLPPASAIVNVQPPVSVPAVTVNVTEAPALGGAALAGDTLATVPAG